MNRIRNRQFLISLLVVILSGVLALNFSKEQFGGYDLSPLIDLTYRFKQGHIPSVDFVNTFPLGLLLVSYALSKFNLSWDLLTLSNALLTLGAYVLIGILAPKRLTEQQKWVWCGSASVFLSMPLLMTNHIWHSSISQLLGIAFFVHMRVFFVKDGLFSTKDLAKISVFAGLLALTKANLLIPALAFSILALLFFTKSPLKPALAIFVGITASTVGSLAFLSMSFSDYLASIWGIRGRAAIDQTNLQVLLDQPNADYLFVLLLIFCILIFIHLTKSENHPGYQKYIAFIILVTSVPFLTDWDTKFNNLTIPMFCVLNAAMLSRAGVASPDVQRNGSSSFDALSGAIVASVALFVLAFHGGLNRDRMRGVGPFFQIPANHTVSDGYFESMRVGQVMSLILSDMRSLKEAAKFEKIFFGPRIEFGYLIVDEESPRGLPLWWHPGSSYSISDESKIEQRFFELNFTMIIFFNDDVTRIPPGILRWIESKNFERISGFQALTVYKRADNKS